MINVFLSFGINRYYDREKAIDYAEKWYDDFNSEQYYHYYMGDCANFVSQCLFAGGIPMPRNWHSVKTGKVNPKFPYYSRCYYEMDVSDSWYKTNQLYNYFYNSCYIKAEVNFVESEIPMIIEQSKIKKGDIMFFSEKHDACMNHVTIISSIIGGRINYAAHTNARWNMSVDKFFQGSPKGCVHVLSLI